LARGKFLQHTACALQFLALNCAPNHMGTLELGGQTGNVGKEIYGAGEFIWIHRMFEALGKISETSFGWKFPAAILRASNTGVEQAASLDFVSVTKAIFNTILHYSDHPSALILPEILAGTTAL
jgi:hypothetical protein